MERRRTHARPQRFVIKWGAVGLGGLALALAVYRWSGPTRSTAGNGTWWAVNSAYLATALPEWTERSVPFCMRIDAQGRVREFAECMPWFWAHPSSPMCGVQNLAGGRWDPEVIQSDPQIAAQNLAQAMGARHCTQLILDLESVRGTDRARLTAWVGQVARRLKHDIRDARVSFAVHAKTRDEGNWDGALAQDWPRLCAASDELLVMAYDQHLPGATPPGEIAELDWVRQVLAYGLTACPATKLRLGLAAYGYDWKTGRVVTEREWRKTPALSSRMSDVFVETREQRKIKMELAQALGIQRFFVWAAGMESPEAASSPALPAGR